MTTPADLQALALMASVDTNEYALAAQRFDVMNASRAFAVSPAEGAQLLNISEELYNKWFNMMAQEDAVSALQSSRYRMMAEIIREARRQHAVQQAVENAPASTLSPTPTVN